MATKKKRSAAQKRATAALVKRNKSKKKGKKKARKKKARKKAKPRKKARKKASRKTVAKGTQMAHVATEVKALADALASAKRELKECKAVGAILAKPTKRRKKTGSKKSAASKKSASKRSASKKAGQKSVSAADILKAASRRKVGQEFWVCAGKTRTGCGGGKRGGHVVTKKGTFVRLRP